MLFNDVKLSSYNLKTIFFDRIGSFFCTTPCLFKILRRFRIVYYHVAAHKVIRQLSVADIYSILHIKQLLGAIHQWQIPVGFADLVPELAHSSTLCHFPELPAVSFIIENQKLERSLNKRRIKILNSGTTITI